MLETAEWLLSAQSAAGARDHEKELRLYDALERMPVRHRSVSALALVRALSMAPDVGFLGKGLRFALEVSAHLAKSRPVKALLCTLKGIGRRAALFTDQVQEFMGFMQSVKPNAISASHRDNICRELAVWRGYTFRPADLHRLRDF